VEQVDIFGKNQDEVITMLCKIDEHRGQPIWSVKHHPSSNLLLSAGADDSVCLLKVFSEDILLDKSKELQFLQHRFTYRDQENIDETPTSIDWLASSVNMFATSYA